MSDESNSKAAPQPATGARLAPSGVMGHDRPLDALLPELRVGRTVPRSPVHPRVLEVDVEGRFEWVFAIWDDPGEPRHLFQWMRKLVEATLLSELSQPPSEVARGRRDFRWLRLLVFDEVADLERAVQAFGFEPGAYLPEQFLGRMAALANEAETMGWDVPDRPTSVWQARVAHPEGALGQQLGEIEALMAERMGGDVWGATPGGPSRLFAAYARQYFKEKLGPSLDGLRSLEMLLVQQRPGVIRWIPPLLFQALADFIGVVAQAEYDLPVAWAECALDESGFAPPPLLRVGGPDGAQHVPIGLHLLRWCVMPLAEGETVPSLADWVVDQFGSRREGD